jgi:hypothetical protein
MKSLGYIVLCEPLKGGRARIFFSDGVVIERALPTRSVSRVQVIDVGLGLRLPGGEEIGVSELRRKKRGCNMYDLSTDVLGWS